MNNQKRQLREPTAVNLLHKLHIFGHFFSIKSGSEVHIACDNVVPQSLSKSAQSPDKIKLRYKNCNAFRIVLKEYN